MKYTSTRRVFLKKLSLGLSSAYLTFNVIRPVHSHPPIHLQKTDEEQLYRISPAYMMNIFANGSVELYTHKPGGERVIHQFTDLDADILIKLSKREDPQYSYQEMGAKYNLDEDTYAAQIASALHSMEDKGFIYKGEKMLVKVKGVAYEE